MDGVNVSVFKTGALYQVNVSDNVIYFNVTTCFTFVFLLSIKQRPTQ